MHRDDMASIGALLLVFECFLDESLFRASVCHGNLAEVYEGDDDSEEDCRDCDEGN